MFDIPCPVGAEFRLYILAESLCQGVIYINQIFTSAVCNIENITCRLMRSKASLEISLDYIFNVCEISRLHSVAVDGRSFVIHQLLNKLRYDRRICSVGILTSAENIKISHSVGIQSVKLCVKLRKLLVNTLRQSVGRKQVALLPLLFRQYGMIAVDRGAGGINKFLDSLLSCRLHHIQRTHYIVSFIDKRHFNASWNASPCRLIEHIVNTLASRHTGVEILDITLDESIVRIIKKEVNVRLLTC